MLVSKISGVPFEEYLEENILKLANMLQSGFFDGKVGLKPEAPATYEGKLIPLKQQRPYDRSFYPSEGMISNVSDLSNWLLLTLSRDERLLNKNTYKEMIQPNVKTTWGDIYIGLGWQIYKENDRLVARHPGGIRGYKSLIISYPEEKNAIVLLTNANETPRFEIAERVIRKLYDLKIWL